MKCAAVRPRFNLVVLLIAGIAACARAHADPSVGEVAEGGSTASADDGDASAPTPTTTNAANGTEPKTDAVELLAA